MERLRDDEGHDEHRPHRRHDGGTDHPFVGMCLVTQPGIGTPGPPQQGQEDKAPQGASRGRVVAHELSDLGKGKHEDEVEQQLQRRHPVGGVGGAYESGSGSRRHLEMIGHSPCHVLDRRVDEGWLVVQVDVVRGVQPPQLSGAGQAVVKGLRVCG